MRVLFVTHDISIYGASRSLQTLLKNYHIEGVKFDLLVNRKIIGRNDLQEIRHRFGSRVENIYQLYLPLDSCWSGATPLPFLPRIKNLISVLTRSLFRKLVRRNKYDIVYLNSLVLHSLITSEFKFVIHVREIFDGSAMIVPQNICNAKGVIFIDKSTSESLVKYITTPSVILNNPFDMKGILLMSDSVPLPFEADNKTVISLIGKMTESKGTTFVIQSFLKAENDKSILLIVGDGEKEFIQSCKSLASGSNNIIFYGEEQEIEKIYKVTDYVIRGEAMPCIGRTVYEGLYSGCDVILPGDFSLVVEEAFIDQVHYYEPRNLLDLAKTISGVNGKKIVKERVKSNVDEYVRSFHSFLENILKL